MDYTQTYEFIASVAEVTNIEGEIKLFYDETNNPRTFRLTNKGFNVNEREYFVLGGIGFKNEDSALHADVNKLFEKLHLQANASEVKFKHIKQNANDFLTLLKKEKVQILIDWLIKNQCLPHYSYVDNF